MSNLKTLELILATDCGSTTTKARLFRKKDEKYRFIIAGEAPTTVEAPYEDVTLGVRNAVKEIEELTGLKLLTDTGIKIRSSRNEEGVDLYVTTSSAGGGLQMSVLGITKIISGESADKAALGAGAVVMDIISTDDEIPMHQKIETIRFLRPDMILLAGGTDGGDIINVVQLAEFIKTANPTARFGSTFKLPIVFAGNKDAQNNINTILHEDYALMIIDNIRPKIDYENPEPARNAIHELFMEHVMSHAPGYDKLMTWTKIPIMPTPMGEGLMFMHLARIKNENVIGVGLGGATTNVYSMYDGRFMRTVSANLGMSYSVCNVLKETGINNICRWVPFSIGEDEVNDILSNKMIRPTTIPSTLNELIIEHAIAREALRLGFIHHKTYTRRLRGVVRSRLAGDAYDHSIDLESYIDMLKVNIIGGTGGLLSHAPRRVQSMLVLIDGFQPEGVTRLIQDSVFMFPHLGVLASQFPDVAYDIFVNDAMVDLGTCVAPIAVAKKGEKILEIELKMPNGDVINENFVFGDIKRFPLLNNQEIEITITPEKKCDVGVGLGQKLTTNMKGGEVGLIIDARGRPSWQTLPENDEDRKKKLMKWFISLDVYPTLPLKELI